LIIFDSLFNKKNRLLFQFEFYNKKTTVFDANNILTKTTKI